MGKTIASLSSPCSNTTAHPFFYTKMAPIAIDPHPVVVTTSHRLATTVASEGGGHGKAFRKRVGNTDKVKKANSEPDYVLPPDVTVEAFERFISRVKDIVGENEVEVNLSSSIDGQADSDYINQPRFHDFFPIVEHGKNMASCAIYATEVGQIQDILKVANETLVPVHTVSIGRNLGYGGAAPRLRGTAVLDLSKMNKIIEVNGEYSRSGRAR